MSDRKIIGLIKATFTAKTRCKNTLQKHAAIFAVKNFHLSSIQLECLITRIKGDLIKPLQVALSNSVVLLGESMLSDLKFIARDVSEKLLRLDSKFFQWCGKSALRPEARLLMLIGTRGPISVKEAMHDSSLSHRSFYMILDKLKDAGIVEVRNDTIDARVRRIYINEEHESKYMSIYECFDDEPEVTSQFESPMNGLRLLK